MLIGQGKTVPELCKELEISQQTYYRWRQKYGGMSPDMIKQFRALQKECSRLRKVVADQALDKLASSGIANQEDLPVLKANIMGDPNVAVGYLDKIAEVANRTRSVVPIGSTFKEATHTPVNGLGAGRPSDALFETTFG